MRKAESVMAVTTLGRVRLSKHFFMRDFLFSDIAAIHGFSNMPSDPDLAIFTGRQLCETLLEPLQDRFGRIAVRSAYRSAEVNGYGSLMQRTTDKEGYTCASNAANAAGHIWDVRDAEGLCGATACIAIPEFRDRFQAQGDWRKLAWWIHDNLPYSSMEFYPKYWAFNLSWHERPNRRIYSYAKPKGYLTKPGFPGHDGSHEALWSEI